MGEAEPEMLNLFELKYSDLLSLASDSFLESSSSDLSNSERQRLDSVSTTVLETLGPTGPGLLSITGVPNSSHLRRKLLPLARKLALIKQDDRKRILKEHRLGSDVPLKNLDRFVSSFAKKLEYAMGNKRLEKGDLNAGMERDFDGQGGDEFADLGDTFEELGQLMIDIGIRLARVCDRAIGGRELEESLIESSAAKGRLIHYHSSLDNLIIREKEAQLRKLNTKSRRENEDKRGLCINTGMLPVKACRLNTCQSEADQTTDQPNLWQQWHYDYGIFTVLTAPMFTSSCDSVQTLKEGNDIAPSDWQGIKSPTGHTCLQVLDTYNNKLVSVKSSPESFIIQVGESADILSKGRLRATLHSVSRPRQLGNVSRETFVVFLQPAWSKIFSLENYSTKQYTAGEHCHHTHTHNSSCKQQAQVKLVDDIQRTIPSLSLRLKDGMTFADFSRETTKQYYGGSGLQSNK